MILKPPSAGSVIEPWVVRFLIMTLGLVIAVVLSSRSMAWCGLNISITPIFLPCSNNSTKHSKNMAFCTIRSAVVYRPRIAWLILSWLCCRTDRPVSTTAAAPNFGGAM